MDPIALFDCRVDEAGMAALRPILSGGMLASGPGVSALERELAAYLGRPHVVALGDMTHALTLALQLSGVRAGDEVLTLAYNCLSSNSAIAALGAVPVWVDIDPAHARMSIPDCEQAMTPKVKALVVYHAAGYPASLPALRQFCDRHRIALIEDANNALGAWSGPHKVGSVGDFAVFSFYANRQVNGIDGAALVCPDEFRAREAERMRRFGIDTPTFRDQQGEIDAKSDVPAIGMSSPMNHVNASLARHHLPSVDERLQKNRSNVRTLTHRLQHVDSISPVAWDSDSQPAFWAWLIRADRRDLLMVQLKRQGIQCSKLHQPNDVYTGFHSEVRDLPGTRRFMEQVLALPCGWWLTEDDLDRIAHAVASSAGAN